MLTSVQLSSHGAWSVASVFDGLDAAISHRVFMRCADGALAVGTAAGTAATLSGLTDAQHVRGEARRVGMVHGMVNMVVTLLQAGSLVQRSRGARGAGRLTSLLAYSGLLVSAHLGGQLEGKYRIGVNRASRWRAGRLRAVAARRGVARKRAPPG